MNQSTKDETILDEYNVTTTTSGIFATLSWAPIKGADGYMILNKNHHSTYYSIADTTNTSHIFNLLSDINHYKLKVAAYKKSHFGKFLLSESQPIDLNDFTVKSMNIHACTSYHGVSLAWIDDSNPNGYMIYRKRDGLLEFICDTEDFLVTLDDVKIGDGFIVLPYKLQDNIKVVQNQSEIFTYTAEELPAPHSVKVSVVIPCYNSEHYITRCIDSILHSTLPDYEIVVIDDGSTDNSPAIVDWYHEHYPGRVIVEHTTNHGISMARNKGIELASGEYLLFSDNDDFIHPQTMEMTYADAIKFNCDIVAFEYNKHNTDVKILRYRLPVKQHTQVSTDEALSRVYAKGLGTVALWNKLYRTSLVKKYPLPILKYEDVSWTPYILSHGVNMSFIDKPFYNWDRRVEAFNKTFSNVLGVRNAVVKADDRIAACRFYIENGNQKKLDLLILVAIRRLVVLAQGYTQTGENPYKIEIENLEKKYGILSNNHIKKDKELYENVQKLLEN